MSFLDSKVSGSTPCPVWMKSKIYKCPNHFPNMLNPDPFVHDLPVNLVVRCCSFKQYLHPGSPWVRSWLQCRAQSLVISMHPAARPPVPATRGLGQADLE